VCVWGGGYVGEQLAWSTPRGVVAGRRWPQFLRPRRGPHWLAASSMNTKSMNKIRLKLDVAQLSPLALWLCAHLCSGAKPIQD
jgi:hypothetical protein